MPLSRWLDAMERVVQDERKSRGLIAAADGKRGKSGPAVIKVETGT